MAGDLNMRNYLAASVLTTVTALAVFSLAVTPAARGQESAGKKNEPKIIRPKAGSPPAPRLPDGHIDLGNGKGSWYPVVIKDISGNGLGDTNVQNANKKGPQMVEKVVQVQMLPWAQKFLDTAVGNLSKDDPEGICLPPGIPRMAATPFPFQIYQLPDRLIFVYEGGAHMWHIVYTDGRKHSTDATDYPSYLGEGIGHWEGDSMVIDNIGFKANSWIDAAGHPHTEKLHVIEKYTRTSLDNMHYEATIEDPETYVKPWTTSWNIVWAAGITPLEYICQEENRDVQHLVGQ
jgi:hypothetical protein